MSMANAWTVPMDSGEQIGKLRADAPAFVPSFALNASPAAQTHYPTLLGAVSASHVPEDDCAWAAEVQKSLPLGALGGPGASAGARASLSPAASASATTTASDHATEVWQSPRASVAYGSSASEAGESEAATRSAPPWPSTDSDEGAVATTRVKAYAAAVAVAAQTAWQHNGLAGDAAEWRGPSGVRVFVRGTFLDIEGSPCAMVAPRRQRARSEGATRGAALGE